MEEVSLIGDHGGQQWVTGDSTGWDSSPNFASEADTAGPAPIVEIFHALFKRFPRMNCIDCHTIMNHNDHNHIYIYPPTPAAQGGARQGIRQQHPASSQQSISADPGRRKGERARE